MVKKAIRVIFAIVLLFFPLLPFTRTVAYASVLINEIYPKPSDGQSQWIELYNTGDERVSMNQWTIQNSTGENKTFILNASAIVSGHGYYVINKSQSNIQLGVNGDSIKLSDNQNTTMDVQGYPGTLGYNTSYGRGPDGGIGLTICNSATPNATNNCPVPTPTPSPTPTSSPTPFITDTPIDPPIGGIAESFSQITNNPSDESIPRIITKPLNIPGIAMTPTPSLEPGVLKIEIPTSIVISKTVLIQIAIILGGWSLLAFIAYTNRQKKKKRIQ